jgi:transcriptional regulator
MTSTIPLLHGSLDGLVLKTLSWGPMHGFGIAKWLRQLTDDALQLEEGTLYPALYRMEDRGWIESEWGVTDNKRRAKYYRLTAKGRAQLKREAESWLHFAAAVTKVFRATRQPA